MQNSAFFYDNNAVLLHDAPISSRILSVESNNPISKRKGARHGIEASTKVKLPVPEFHLSLRTTTD